jgi:hypothetical protein
MPTWCPQVFNIDSEPFPCPVLAFEVLPELGGSVTEAFRLWRAILKGAIRSIIVRFDPMSGYTNAQYSIQNFGFFPFLDITNEIGSSTLHCSGWWWKGRTGGRKIGGGFAN